MWGPVPMPSGAPSMDAPWAGLPTAQGFGYQGNPVWDAAQQAPWSASPWKYQGMPAGGDAVPPPQAPPPQAPPSPYQPMPQMSLMNFADMNMAMPPSPPQMAPPPPPPPRTFNLGGPNAFDPLQNNSAVYQRNQPPRPNDFRPQMYGGNGRRLL